MIEYGIYHNIGIIKHHLIAIKGRVMFLNINLLVGRF
jgi:hypothetical protein